MTNGSALSVSCARTGAKASVYDYAYTNVEGRGYTSYNAIDSGNSVLAADDLNLSTTSNEIDLYGNNVTITRGSTESITAGGGTFALANHANETIQAGTAASETFSLSSGFGNETIYGFSASKGADTLDLSISAFSYLNAGMTQAQDLAAVLNHMNGSTITDTKGNSLTLAGVVSTYLSANPGAIHFV